MEAPPPITRVVTGSRRKAASFRRAVARQPSWVIRVALTAFLLVIAVPVVLVLAVALLAAVIVFAMLAVLNQMWSRVRGAFGPGDGRQNVRVVPPRPPQAGDGEP